MPESTDRIQLVLRVLLEAPNHESYAQEISSAIGLDDEEVVSVLRCFEDVGLVESRDGRADRRYHRLS